MFRCSAGELPSVPPPSLLGELRAAHPNDIEFARAQKGDVIGLGQKPRPVLYHLFQFFEGFPTLFDGSE